MARIVRQKMLYQKNFTLVEYGTWEAARAAAQDWIDSIKGDLPQPIPIKDRMTRRNASGMVGVQLKTSVKIGKGATWTHYAWHAFWPANRSGTSWGIIKYGDDRAFVCAAISRKLEITDRKVIDAEYQRIKGSAEYYEILSHKTQLPP